MVSTCASLSVLSVFNLVFLSYSNPVARNRDKYVDAQESQSRDGDEFCYDERPDCNATDFFCGTRPREMSQNCKLTCEMCSPGDPFKQMDLSSKCAAELEKHGEGYCLEKGWTAACPHSCREFSCKDWIPPDCHSWASAGDCLSNHQYMTEICKLSCAMCVPDDPVMDTSSVCKHQGKRCRDPEWQNICPHTCRQYISLRPGNLVPPSQSNQPLPLLLQPNVAAQHVQAVAPPLTPSQSQQPVGATQTVTPLQPNGMTQAVQTPLLGGSAQVQQPQIPIGGAQPGGVPQTVVQPLRTGGPVQLPLQPNRVAPLQPTQTNPQPLPQTQLQAQNLHQAAVAPAGLVSQPTQPQINQAIQPTHAQLQSGMQPSVPRVPVQQQPQQLYPTSPVGQPMPIQGPYQPQAHDPASRYWVAGSMKKQKGKGVSKGEPTKSAAVHVHQKTKNSDKPSKTDTNAMESRKARTSNKTGKTSTSKEANARTSDRKAEQNGDTKRKGAFNKRKRKGMLFNENEKLSERDGKKVETIKQDNL